VYLFHFGYIEDGIYCELNLEECITYAIPPGSTGVDLEPLALSLLRQAHRWQLTATDTDTDTESAVLVESEALSGVVWSIGDETDSALVLPDSVTGLDLLTPVSLPLRDCVGSIAAESVSKTNILVFMI